MFKLYKTVVSVMFRNLLLQKVESLFNVDDSIYIYAILGLEIPSLILMVIKFVLMKKMIREYDLAEFDLIRENFTHDFHKKINQSHSFNDENNKLINTSGM
jgi:hypothetical protein